MALLLAGNCDFATAADTQPTTVAKPAPAAKTAPIAKSAEAKRPPIPVGRRLEFISAMILWFAIIVVGFGLVVSVMVLGRRLRRRVRYHPPAATVPDPFWYLKKNPSTVPPGDASGRLKQPDSGPDPEGLAAP